MSFRRRRPSSVQQAWSSIIPLSVFTLTAPPLCEAHGNTPPVGMPLALVRSSPPDKTKAVLREGGDEFASRKRFGDGKLFRIALDRASKAVYDLHRLLRGVGRLP